MKIQYIVLLITLALVTGAVHAGSIYDQNNKDLNNNQLGTPVYPEDSCRLESASQQCSSVVCSCPARRSRPQSRV